MMQNPSPEQMRDMIEALFAKTDEFRAQHDLCLLYTSPSPRD